MEKEGVIIIGGSFAAIVGIVFLALWMAETACYQRWDNSGREVQWSALGGCQIRLSGAWVPAENIRVNGAD